jgi:PleD family two-component response regulator
MVDQPIETSAGQLPVTLSLGLASVEQDEKETIDFETFLRTADEALYAAKARGRNRVETGHASALRVPDLGLLPKIRNGSLAC